jgi:hypothetical protein
VKANRLLDALIAAEDAIRTARTLAEEWAESEYLAREAIEILDANGDVPAEYSAEVPDRKPR